MFDLAGKLDANLGAGAWEEGQEFDGLVVLCCVLCGAPVRWCDCGVCLVVVVCVRHGAGRLL